MTFLLLNTRETKVKLKLQNSDSHRKCLKPQIQISETAPQNYQSGYQTTIITDFITYLSYQILGNFIASNCLIIYLKFGLLLGIGSQHSFINFANCSGVFFGIVGLK